MPPRVLVLVAHPDHASSRVTAALTAAVRDLDHVTVHDLTAAAATDAGFDVAAEQDRLRRHDVIVWQFPWYWYSVPGVLKEWMDRVLTHGFAYGTDGDALHGKTLQIVTSTGGPEMSYQPDGYNRFTMAELMLPIDATAHLCGLRLAEPLVLHGARTVTDQDLADHSRRYRALLSQDLMSRV